jgi:hypothetical protein
MQCTAAFGVLVGTVAPSCTTNDECALHEGTFCEAGSEQRCSMCSNGMALFPKQVDERTGLVLNRPDDPRFGGFNVTAVAEMCAVPGAIPDWVWFHGEGKDESDHWTQWSDLEITSWCEACVHAIDHTVDPTTGASLFAANVGSMGPFDSIALVFAFFIVTCAVAGEL